MTERFSEPQEEQRTRLAEPLHPNESRLRVEDGDWQRYDMVASLLTGEVMRVVGVEGPDVQVIRGVGSRVAPYALQKGSRIVLLGRVEGVA